MNIKNCPAYELMEEKRVADLNSNGYVMRHKKTGARVLILENDDDNKVFSIGFRTPPYDSTGLPHIMEHSVLCGSKNFPAKDPFVELAKGSLNTFLNAMTFPDKTLYPVASCNDKDFRNLIHVYLDAVFYPNIYSREEIFKQEGWHYELASAEDELSVNGVVYNEMKGVFSSADDIISRRIFDSLFPDTCYGVESGGDPDIIPTLTYEAFLDYHRTYYHPSNSYIYLYGNGDNEALLSFIDKEYLSDFDAKEVDSGIKEQKAFDEIIKISDEFGITEDEPLEENTYLSYNAVIGNSLDEKLYVAFQVIEYALLSAPGAILKQTLLDKGIGKDIQSAYDNGILQPYFSVIAKGANAEDEDAFIETINEVLSKIVAEGFDKKMLRAALNSFEFKYREADFGHYPKGLIYNFEAYASWLYEGDPFMHLEANDTFTYLKEQVDGDYFENLVKEYLINNKHASIVTLSPKVSLNAAKDADYAQKLNEYKESLGDDEINELIEMTKHLKQYQEEKDDDEVLATIPLLSIEDIKKEAMPYENEEIKLENALLLHQDIFTNGISYLKILFETDKVPAELIPYLGLLKNVLGLMDTENYKYADLSSEIDLNSGGIYPSTALYPLNDSYDEYRYCFEMSGRVLDDKQAFAFDMFEEILLRTSFADTKRLKELANMIKSRMQASLMSAGHSFASDRAKSCIAESSAASELVNGISFYRFMEDITGNFDEKAEEIKSNLKKTLEYVVNKDSLVLFNVTADKKAAKSCEALADAFASRLPDNNYKKREVSLVREAVNEGFKTSGKVQYVALAGRYLDDEHPFTGAFKILNVIFGYDYLWNNVRVLGGAYGCFSSFARDGEACFVSYRDPNLKNTLEIYKKAADYLDGFTADERTMTKYIIGTISNIDAPLTPNMKGKRSLSAYMTKDTLSRLQRERDEILGADDKDISALADYLRLFTQNPVLCVLGAEETIKKDEALFDTAESLFRS